MINYETAWKTLVTWLLASSDYHKFDKEEIALQMLKCLVSCEEAKSEGAAAPKGE